MVFGFFRKEQIVLDHPIIDSHIHLDQYANKELPEFIRSMRGASCTHAIAVSTNLASAKRTLELARTYKEIIPAAGFHPEQPLPAEEEIEELFTWIAENEQFIAAIGEIGLPTYLFREQPDLDLKPYIQLLERFLELAVKLDKPAVLHAVHDEADIVCDLLDNSGVAKAHFHWFKGSRQTMDRIFDKGFYISVTPEVVYRQKIQDIAHYSPLDLLMVETDGPWPFSGPFTEARTHPRMIHESIKAIAAIKQIELEKVYEQVYENSTYFYDLE